MVNIIKKELEIDMDIKAKIDSICKFLKLKPTYFNGYLRQIERTNLIYFNPHVVIINGITFLFFNNSDEIYIKNLKNKLPINKLEKHLKSCCCNFLRKKF